MMTKTYSRFKKAAFAAVAVLALTSCDSFLKEYSQDLAKVETWEDLDEILVGQGYFPSWNLDNSAATTKRENNFDFLHFMTDEVTMGVEDGANYGYLDAMFPYFTWQQEPGMSKEFRYEGGDDSFWNTFYARINTCNMILSLIDDQPAPAPSDREGKMRVRGEALFLRALSYVYLTNLYCEPYDPATADSKMGIPVKTSEFVEDVEFSRSTLRETYDFILSDLREAENLLSQVQHKSLYRADRDAVRLFLSRVCLYVQDWAGAAAYAAQVMESHPALRRIDAVTPGENVVSLSSPETIFSMGDYAVAAQFADVRGWGEYPPLWNISDEIFNLYDDTDFRKTRFFGRSQYGHSNRALYKYNGSQSYWGTLCDVGSIFLFRSPEAYLNYAEASAIDGKEDEAKSALRKFLATRMSAVPALDMTGADLVAFIRDERAREFVIEGQRWFDLRRYSVCAKYPWGKTIQHGFAYHANYSLDHVDWYRLSPDDGGFTFALPRSVRSFQVSLGSYDRPYRTAYAVTADMTPPSMDE